MHHTQVGGKRGKNLASQMHLLPLYTQETPESQIPEEEKLLGEAAGGQDINDSVLMQSFEVRANTDQVSSDQGGDCGILLLPICTSR